MKRIIVFILLLMPLCYVSAQRSTDVLNRGLVAVKTASGVYLSWRLPGEEYYNVAFNVYRDGVKITEEPISVSNFTDASGTVSNTYTVAPVVRGVEQEDCEAVSVWRSNYKTITLKHEGIKSRLCPNDACCADVDGDGELEILMKFDNIDEVEQAYPKYGPTVNGEVTGEYTIFECLKQDGTMLWWVNCGPNMGDFQNNEQNIVGYDWDQDGKAEAVMRLGDGAVIHMADGSTYTVGSTTANIRGETGGGVNWFIVAGYDGSKEYLVYVNGMTGKPYQCIDYPLPLLESGETDLAAAWGNKNWAHRASKHFFGAPYLDGRKPSIFLARGIYTRHKMVALDVDPATHKLTERWRWNCNADGPWKGNGYHNFGVADVDMDGRDEIVFGSMVIDDNGKGLSTTGFGHGDAQHCSDLDPYRHGLEIYACLEDAPNYGNNYRDATTSKVYHHHVGGRDDGRSMAGNFCNDFPGCIGVSNTEGFISTVTDDAVQGLSGDGVHTNFRIYWDGDLCEETFTGNTVCKFGSWNAIYTCEGGLSNNGTKATPCYQGDIFGDWREEIIERTEDNNIRIYTTTMPTEWRNYTLWHDHQYRNAMVWQMCGYNQPPHCSYFLGEMEGITIAPPPLTNTGREEVKDGGSITAAMNGQHVMVCETGNTQVSITEGASPAVMTFNVPTWVQGTAPSECTTKNTTIRRTTYTCNVTGGGFSGNTRLVKQGDGILCLPQATFNHTGQTDVWGGTLNFSGAMKSSDLWLNRYSILEGTAQYKSITAEYGSEIRPGGAEAKGSITADDYTMGFGSRLVVDLYAEDITADVLKVNNMTIEEKTDEAWIKGGPAYLSPVIEVVGHAAEGAERMTPGKYVVAEVSGNVTGNVDCIVVEGLPEEKKKLYMEGGKLILEILPMRDATTVYWSGDKSNVWDFANTANFSNEGNEDFFVNGDAVVFDDAANNFSISLAGDLQASGLLFTGSKNYTLSGEGRLTGVTTITHSGTGTVRITNDNIHTGETTIENGIVSVPSLSNSIQTYGPLGAYNESTGKSPKITLSAGGTLKVTGETTCSSILTTSGEDGGIIDNSAALTIEKAVAGTVLTKKGSGTLKLTTAPTVRKIVMQTGSLSLATNSTTPLELQGGILYDDAQNTAHAIDVPDGKKATWQLSWSNYTGYNNTLTGSGTLTIVPRNTVSRVSILGGWNSFEGTIVHSTTGVWLPLKANMNAPKMTLQLEEGCTAGSSPGCTYTLGAVTGKGTLANAGRNFGNNNVETGNVTWNVGNSLGHDFTFSGTVEDGSASIYCTFNKVGTCTMTYNGTGMNITHAVNVSGGLVLNKADGAGLGTGKLTLQNDAELTVTAATLSNGTLQANSGSRMTVKSLDFDGTAMNFASGSTLVVGNGVSGTLDAGSADITVAGGADYATYIRTNTSAAKLTTTGTVTLDGTFTLTYNSSARGIKASALPSWQLIDAGNIVLGNDFNWNLQELPEGYYWNTDLFATEGRISITDNDPTGVNTLKTVSLGSEELTEAYTVSGAYVGRPKRAGIYIQNGIKYMVK